MALRSRPLVDLSLQSLLASGYATLGIFLPLSGLVLTELFIGLRLG